MLTQKLPCVYILANGCYGTLYTGVSSNLQMRVHQHKAHQVDGFTKRYNVTRLVWYECTESMITAIEREKQIKAGSRRKKIALIEAMNPEWRDLYQQIL